MTSRTDSKVEEKEARRRRREIFFIFLILFVLIVLTSLEFSLGRFRTGLPFNDSILFFSIININIILILLLIFLILRNVVKLVFERRRRILGAHLRNKLVAAFVILSLVPTGILFYVAWSFISRSIEMWVHVQVERALEGSLAVARTYYKSQAEDTLFFAKQIKQAMNREGILRGGKKDNLREFSLPYLDHDSHSFSIRLIPDICDSFDLFAVDQGSDILQKPAFIDLIWNLGDDDPVPFVLSTSFDHGTRSEADDSLSRFIGALDSLQTKYISASGKIRAGHKLHDFFQ